jgi:hypothetical protein
VILAALAFLGACRPSAVGGAATGASSSAAAVQEFLNAGRAQDIQALSAVWGNDESPVRDRVDRQELERRLLIMVCHLRHEESRIGAPQAGEAGRIRHSVELVNGGTTATSAFTTVRNRRSGRWFVEDFDMEPLRRSCMQTPRASAAGSF